MITVACVWTGDKYGVEYVTRLRNMVTRHLNQSHRFVCFTDRPHDLPKWMIYEIVNIAGLGLDGWWGKIALFHPSLFNHDGEQLLYFDLDTVIVGDLTPLADWRGDFGICQNFTMLAGHKTWCRFGSCVMSFSQGHFRYQVLWDVFSLQPALIQNKYPRGDQEFIADVIPHATYLQDVVPPGFFLGYRQLGPIKPDDCSVVVFAGSHTPENCPYQWVKDEWQ